MKWGEEGLFLRWSLRSSRACLSSSIWVERDLDIRYTHGELVPKSMEWNEMKARCLTHLEATADEEAAALSARPFLA